LTFVVVAYKSAETVVYVICDDRAP